MSNNICTENYTIPPVRYYEVPPAWIIAGAKKIAEDITEAPYCDSWEMLLSTAENRLEIMKSDPISLKAKRSDINALDWSIGILKRMVRLNVPFPVLGIFVQKD